MKIAGNTFVSLLQASTYLAVCLPIALLLPARASSEQKEINVSTLTLADVQQSGSQTNCPRQGAARIRLDQHLFFVPRILLIHVENEKGLDDTSWRCSDTEIGARSFYIDVRANHVGQNFYKTWIENRRLPRTIHLTVRGKFKNFLDRRFLELVAKGENVKTAENEFRYIETQGQTYYDASARGMRGFAGQAIIYQCSPRQLKENARVCSTYYHLNDAIDLRYRFLDPPFSLADWSDLDARTRQFVRQLAVPQVR